MTLTEHHIPRRCYQVPTKSKTKEDPSQTPFFYTEEKKPTWAVITALEEEIRSEDLANHKGSLILDTPPEDIPRQEKPRIINRKTRKNRIRGRGGLFQIQTVAKKPADDQTPSQTFLYLSLKHILRFSSTSYAKKRFLHLSKILPRWSKENPLSTDYFYDEPIPKVEMLDKGNAQHVKELFPPTKMNLSDAWVAKIVHSNLDPQQRSQWYPLVFTQKLLSSTYRNKGMAAKTFDTASNKW